jgi:hypothetical protein
VRGPASRRLPSPSAQISTKFVCREAVFGFLQEILDCGGPAIEVVGQAFVHAELFFGDFEG